MSMRPLRPTPRAPVANRPKRSRPAGWATCHSRRPRSSGRTRLLDNIPTSWYDRGWRGKRPMQTSQKHSAKDKILEAALAVIRTKGYAATTVDDLCAAAGVTKGAFFHHFKSKEELAVAAAEFWSQMTGNLFAQAPYHRHADPLDRVIGYIDFRKSLLT